MRRSSLGRVLCGTEDGGRHWRPVFFGFEPNPERSVSPEIVDVRRWSTRAGIVSLHYGDCCTDLNGALFWHEEYWTRDGGRHWYRTDAFYAGLSGGCVFDHPQECTLGVRLRQQPRTAIYFDLDVVTLSQATGCSIGEPCLHEEHAVVRYRLLGWPPTGQVRCGGEWRRSRWTNVCVDFGQPADAGMHAVRLGS